MAVTSHSIFRGVAQPGSALALGARGPRFESARPDQTSLFSGTCAIRFRTDRSVGNKTQPIFNQPIAFGGTELQLDHATAALIAGFQADSESYRRSNGAENEGSLARKASGPALESPPKHALHGKNTLFKPPLSLWAIGNVMASSFIAG